MLNFPVASGTSGHLLGGLLAAVLVGPWVGALCIGVVLFVQALVFADGGLSALGLNIVNMALVTALGGYLVFRGLRVLLPRTKSGVVIASGVAGFLSVVLASLVFTLEYALGGAGGASVSTVIGAMVSVHVLIGIGEGLITAATIAVVLAVRPDVVYGASDLEKELEPGPASSRAPEEDDDRERRTGMVLFAAGALLVALLLAAFVSPFSSASPDGLNRSRSTRASARRKRVRWPTVRSPGARSRT